MYQALYRKYRPKSFDEIVGQDVIVKTLKNSIKNNIVSHAYLLSGPRGTGKTSIAKIFAKVLNCYNLNELEPCNECISCIQANNNQNIDIIEIDAASNNGVDEIREIRNKITLVPTNSKYKIYIIDEVHMLTNQAFNALLKTLEEPPTHIIFIFATTEPQKIPQTILSRCQRFDYKKVGNEEIAKRLKFISEKEGINITDEALLEIAKLSDGGVRDSISLLDQAFAYSDNEISMQDIHSINGTLIKEEIENFVIDLLNRDLVNVVSKIEKYDAEGKNIVKITQEIIEKLKDCILYLNARKLFSNSDAFYERVQGTGNSKDIYVHIKSLSSLINEMKNTNNSKILLEIEFIKNVRPVEELIYNEKKNTESIKNESNGMSEKNNETECSKEVKQQQVETKKTFDYEKFEQLKKIRVSNSLYKFSQKEREKVKKEFDSLNEYILEHEYSKYISIINDGELKSVSDNNLMFIYKSELIAESFNLDIKNIENTIEKCLKKQYKVIAINFDEWDFIKNDYNKNKNNYVYTDEKNLFDVIYNVNTDFKKIKTNSIDDMFDDIIEYE